MIEFSARPFSEISKNESTTKFELSEENFLIKRRKKQISKQKEVNIHHDNE